MRKVLSALFVAATLALLAGSGCTTNPATGLPTLSIGTSSPEAQIKTGADAETAAATLATALLKNGKMTVSQAKSISTMLHAASTALDDANKVLLTCRASTGSTAATKPDPCSIGVAEVVALAVSSIASIQKTLSTK